jgi:peroxiredoxin
VQLQSQLGELRRHGVSVVGISADPADDSRALRDKLGLDFPLLLDPQLVAIRAWGVADEPNEIAWPAVFLVDAAGRITWRSLSRTYKVRPGTNELLRAIDALGGH